MKQLDRIIQWTAPKQARGTFLAGLAALAAVALVSSALLTPARAAGDPRHEDRDGPPPSQEAEILQLLADFHGALSYGGDLGAMSSIWAEDSSIALNGVSHVGKPAVMTFFVTGGYFLNNWVSLAPEYKTQITVHGDRAEASTQCVAIDLSVTPMVVKSVIQVNATAVRRHGKWLFTSMNNTTPAPL